VTIGKKLFLGVGALATLTFALGLTAYLGMASIGDHVRSIDRTVRERGFTTIVNVQSGQVMSNARGLYIYTEAKDKANIGNYAGQVDANIKEEQTAMDALVPMLLTPEGKETGQAIQKEISISQEGATKLRAAAVAGDLASVADILEHVIKPSRIHTKELAVALDKRQGERLAKDEDGTNVAIATNSWITAGMCALAILFSIALIYVVRQINAVLRRSVSELSEASQQIATAAHHVAETSQSMAQGSSQQAATIEETSAASAEISAMARRAMDSSTTTAEIVTNSQKSFLETDQSLTSMVGAMEEINTSSHKISKIIKVIDEISFQTNILALNAAVEAARAGEAGLGFAVVAEEVRNLAQRCATAAKDTAGLIEDSVHKSNEGKVSVDRVATAIRSITAETSKIKDLVDEVNQGSKEQVRGIDQITHSITQMEQTTQSAAAHAEESAATAEQLSAQAETMRVVVQDLRIMVDGAALAA
jgi:methyl-accepting chemotaxis protein/methyl-accepting chemotaxis protein-1 (serine sensor receptor)